LRTMDAVEDEGTLEKRRLIVKNVVIAVGILTVLVLLYKVTALRGDRVHYEWRFDVVIKNLPFLLQGIMMSVAVALASMAVGLITGMVAALARLSKNPWLSASAYCYVEFFRTTPMLVQLVWVYYCLPIIFNLSFGPFASSIIALGLNAGAFFSEIFRAGITSIAKGQTEAALALGMTTRQAFRRIILPQAITRMLPPIGSNWISLIKDSSLVSAIALADLMYRGRVLSSITYRPLEILTVTAILYFLLTYPQSIWVNWLHRKYATAD